MDNHSPLFVPESSHAQVPSLSIRLLGGMSLLLSDIMVTLPMRLHTRRLLAMLILAPGVMNRSVLATQLWPDLPETEALAALRRHLSDLRKYAAKSLDGIISIVRFGQNIELQFHSQHGVDVADLFALMKEVEAQAQTQPLEMMRIIDETLTATTRPLLDGWDDTWLEPPRMWIAYARQVLSDVISTQSAHRDAPDRIHMGAPIPLWRLAAVREENSYRMQEAPHAVGAPDLTAPTSALYTNPQSPLRHTTVPNAMAYGSHIQYTHIRQTRIEHACVLDDHSNVDEVRTAVPLYLNAFVGRPHELEFLSRSLVEHAMVVVTGPVGVGKTRLVTEHLQRHTSPFHESPFWIDGESCSNALPLAVLAMRSDCSMSNRECSDSRPVTDSLRKAETADDAVAVSKSLCTLMSSRTLPVAADLSCSPRWPIFVFDHFDLRQSLLYSNICTIRRRFPSACIVAILRSNHALPNASVLDIAPLSSRSLPPARSLAVVRQVSRSSEASDLFFARMRELGSPEPQSDSSSTLVSALCARVDGSPLAIEVLTERTLVMSPNDLYDMTRIALGSRIVGSPLSTSSEYLKWRLDAAWNSASSVHLQVMERIWVFQRNFGNSEVQFVLDDDQDLSCCAEDVASQISSLTGHGWIELDHRKPHEVRYYVPTIVREYAHWKARLSPHVAATRQAHAQHFLSKVASLAEGELEFDEIALDASLDADREDICSAITNFRLDDRADLQSAIDAAVVLWRYWISRGLLAEETAWVERLVTLAAECGLQLHYALACDVAAMMHYAIGNVASAAQFGHRSVRSFRMCGPSNQMSIALIHLAGILAMSGEMASAGLLAREAVGYVTPDDDLVHVIDILGIAADIFIRSGEVQSADEMLATARGLVGTIFGSPRKASRVYLRLGTTAIERGEYQLACELLHVAEQQSVLLAGAREHDRVSAELALAFRWMGRTEDAARILAKVIRSAAEAGDRLLQLICLCNLADIWCDEMRWQSALLSISYARDVPDVSITNDLELDICNMDLVIAMAEGDTSRRIDQMENLRVFTESVADPISIGWAYRTLSVGFVHAGDFLRARHFSGESIRRLQSCGSLGSLLRSVEVASCAVSATSPTAAARILGACNAERVRIGAPRTPREVKDVEIWTAAIVGALGSEETEAQIRAGESTSLEAAVDIALSLCSSQEMSPS